MEGELDQRVYRRIAEIRNCKDLMLNHALDRGMEGSFRYHPRSPELKEAYGLGLHKWLKRMNIWGIDAFDLTDPSVMRGFVYTLVANDKLEFKVHEDNSHINQRRVCQEEIKKILDQYEGTRKIIPEIDEERKKFELGIQLAVDYIAGKTVQNFLPIAKKLGLDCKRLSDQRLKRYIQSFDDVYSSAVDGPLDGPIRLYNSKRSELSDFLIEGRLDSAMEACDYLEIVVRYMKRLDEEVGLDDVFEIGGKMKDLQKQRRDIAERMENPAYDLERRMNDLVRIERYEEAAKVRDELKRVREEIKKLNTDIDVQDSP